MSAHNCISILSGPSSLQIGVFCQFPFFLELLLWQTNPPERKLAKHASVHCKTFDQSNRTLLSNLSGQPDFFLGFGTLKRSGPKYGVQKTGCKNQGHCYSKRVVTAWPLLFLNNNDLFFAPCFSHPIFWT